MGIKQMQPLPFFYPGNKTGILLIHGFTGSTVDLSPMGLFYKKRGYTVHAPLLAGHGTTPEDMAKTRWLDWWQSALEGYERLTEYGCTKIAVAGLSMGGLLTLRLSLFRPVVAMMTMNPAIMVRDKNIRWAKYIHYFHGKVPRGRPKEEHIEKQLFSYSYTPVVCAASLWSFIQVIKKELPQIKTPILIQQGERDETVFPEGASYIYKEIGSNYREVKYYPKSGHIITLDREQEGLFHDGEAFLEKVLWGCGERENKNVSR